jgi:hypothetical protein
LNVLRESEGLAQGRTDQQRFAWGNQAAKRFNAKSAERRRDDFKAHVAYVTSGRTVRQRKRQRLRKSGGGNEHDYEDEDDFEGGNAGKPGLTMGDGGKYSEWNGKRV